MLTMLTNFWHATWRSEAPIVLCGEMHWPATGHNVLPLLCHPCIRFECRQLDLSICTRGLLEQQVRGRFVWRRHVSCCLHFEGTETQENSTQENSTRFRILFLISFTLSHLIFEFTLENYLACLIQSTHFQLRILYVHTWLYQCLI